MTNTKVKKNAFSKEVTPKKVSPELRKLSSLCNLDARASSSLA